MQVLQYSREPPYVRLPIIIRNYGSSANGSASELRGKAHTTRDSQNVERSVERTKELRRMKKTSHERSVEREELRIEVKALNEVERLPQTNPVKLADSLPAANELPIHIVRGLIDINILVVF